jgi:hypothetical protein
MSSSWAGYDLNNVANRYQQMFITNYLDISGRLLVNSGDVSFNNGNLYVAKNVGIGMVANSGYELDVLGDVRNSGLLVVFGDASFNNRLIVGNDSSFNSNLYVGKIVGIGMVANSGYELDVLGDVRNNGLLIVVGDASLNSRLVVGDDIIVNKRLFTMGDCTINGNLSVSGIITGNVTGTATNASNVTIATQGTNDIFYPTFVSANSGNLPIRVDNQLTYNPSTNVLTTTLFNGTATNANNATNAENIEVVLSGTALKYITLVDGTGNRAPQIDTNFTFDPTTNILEVPNITTTNGTINGNLFVNNDISLNGNITLGKDLTIKGRLNVQNYTNNNIINTTVNNYQLIVSEDLSLNGNINILGNVSNVNLINKIKLTAPTNSATLSLGDQTTVTTSGNITLIGNSGAAVSLTLPTVTGTLANLVSPSFITPNIGVATATTINKITLTAPAINATLTLGNNTTVTNSGNINLVGNTTAAAQTLTLPQVTGTLATLAGTEAFTNKTISGLTVSTTTGTLTIGSGTTVTTAGNISLVGSTTSAVALTLPTATGTLATLASPTFTGTVTAPTYLATTGITIGSSVTTTYPLYVSATTTSIALSNVKYFNSSVTTNTSLSTGATVTPTTNNGIFSTGAIVSNNGFFASSDKRIKYNIHDFADIPSIQLLRYLKPRIFNFIDEVQHGTDPTWGFIAQEVAEIIPNAVTYGPNYIPNIFEVGELIGKEIKLGSKIIAELLKDENDYYPLKIKNTNGEDKMVKITEIIDEKTFKIDQEIETEHNRVFVYGQEVPDFHSLDKDAIFTITTSAVQEIDKELQKQIEITKTQNEIISDLQNKVTSLQSQIDEINKKLA